METLYTFWEGKKPAYIDLCMQTWKIPYVVLNYENLREYTDLSLDKLRKFPLQQVADIVRVHVLRDNGGYWLDADTILLDDRLPDSDILGNNNTRLNTIGFLHTQAGSDMFTEWASFQDHVMSQEKPIVKWYTFGNAFTDNYYKEHSDIFIGDITKYWVESGVPQDTPRKRYVTFYFDNNYSLQGIHTDMLMLHNSWTPDWYKQLSHEGVLQKNCTLSNILRGLLT